MGQQQLLLIALSVIIVGAAVAVGVNMLQKGSEQAKVDKFYQHASIMSANISSAYKKPTSMGGLGQDFSKLSSISGSNPTAAKCSRLGIKDSTANSAVYVDGVTSSGSGDAVEVTLKDTTGKYSGTFEVKGSTGKISWPTPVTQ